MADGSREDRTDPKLTNDATFSAADTGHGDTKKCSDQTFNSDGVNLSFYTEPNTSDSSLSERRSASRGVAIRSAAVGATDLRKSSEAKADDGDDRKKRCFDRYDSSESSDRFRSTNYRKEDQNLLTNLINKYKGILMCKKTGKVTPQLREKTWMKLHDEYNAQCSDYRSIVQLKNKWENMKRTARKRYAAHKQELRKTGGGPPPPDMDDTTNFLISVSKEGIEGLNSEYDNDKSCGDSVLTMPIEEAQIINDVSDVNSEVTSDIENIPSCSFTTPTEKPVSPETKNIKKPRRLLLKNKILNTKNTTPDVRNKFNELAELKLNLYKLKAYKTQFEKEKEELEIQILKEKLEHAKKENIKIDLEISILRKQCSD